MPVLSGGGTSGRSGLKPQSGEEPGSVGEELQDHHQGVEQSSRKSKIYSPALSQRSRLSGVLVFGTVS